MRCSILLFAPLLALTACGGKKSASVPPPPPNDPPALQVPTGLNGTGGTYQLALTTTNASSLMFTATDPEGDSLVWQVGASAQVKAAVGAVYTSPTPGALFVIELQPVPVPAAGVLNVLVEDPHGNASAIDLLVVRTGAPTISSVAPSSAFASAAQRATIQGTGFSLGGSVLTVPRFGGLAGPSATIVDDSTLMCNTPTGGALGPTVVSVTHTYGSASLPAGSFTMLGYPPMLAAADEALDGGAGAQLAAANDGPVLQAVFVEGGTLQHRASADGGASWTPAQTLSGGEVPSTPRVVVVGQQVTVVWIGNGTTLNARNSNDGGATFGAASVLNPIAGGAPASAPQLVANGARRYCAWLGGDSVVNQQRVTVASSPDDGATWTPATIVSNRGTNQRDLALGCDGANAWVAYFDNPTLAPLTGPGVYTSRSNDGGITWTGGVRRSGQTIAIGSIRVCNDAERVFLVYGESGTLRYLASIDAALSWPTLSLELRGTDLGALSEPAVACEADRLYAVYVAGGNNLAFSRVGGTGAVPQHVTLSTTTDPVGEPRIVASGNYLFAAWRSGDIGTNAARVLRSSSTNLGVAFATAAGFGDGTANQDQPVLLVDGAKLWFGWLDARGGMSLFQNRTQS